MIKLPIKIILLLHVLVVSSCSSLDVLKENYQNFLSTSSNKFYVVEEGDSIWSMSIKLNLDPQLLISNNSLDKPYIIYPDQKLALYEYSNIQLGQCPLHRKRLREETDTIVPEHVIFQVQDLTRCFVSDAENWLSLARD